MTNPTRSAPTVAQVAALRYLRRSYTPSQMGGRVFDALALVAYYQRNGRTANARGSAGREGAARRMFWRLYDAGYIEGQQPHQGYVLTEAGRKVADAK